MPYTYNPMFKNEVFNVPVDGLYIIKNMFQLFCAFIMRKFHERKG
jgi:hypothetical protein